MEINKFPEFVDGQIHYPDTGFPDGNFEKLWVRRKGNL